MLCSCFFLVLAHGVNLGLGSASRLEFVGQECIDQLLAQLVADSKCTETGNVRILAECLTNLPLYVT